jgi:hypothetical protein
MWVESPGYDSEQLPGSEFIIALPITVVKPAGKKAKIKRLK